MSQGDLADRAAVDAVAAPSTAPTRIMHFASYTLVGESMEKPFLYLGDNVTNGLNLLESAVEHGVRRFILSSTANLFDDPERMPIDENERIVPGSPYGESKYILERMLHWLDRTEGLRYAACATSTPAAPRRSAARITIPETHLIPLVLQVALGQREDITIFGDDYPTPDGTCVRDYIHVVDLAQAHILALQRSGRRQPHLQPGQRPGLHRQGGDRHGARGDRPPDPRTSAPAAPATRPCWSPAATRSAASWAGSPSTPTCAPSSRRRGSGICRTRRGMRSRKSDA